MGSKMKLTKISALAGAVAFAASPAVASTILIDDFTDAGSIESNGDGNPATLNVTGSNIISSDPGVLDGERFMWVSTDDAIPSGTSVLPEGGTTFEAGLGLLNFGNGPASNATTPPIQGTGQAVLVYDGSAAAGDPQIFDFNSVPQPPVVSATDFPSSTTASINVDTDGLGGVDFLDGFDITQRGIEFEFSSFDPGGQLDFRAYAWDTTGALVTFQELLVSNTGLPTDVDFDTLLGLDEFTGDPFDWTSVGAIAFSVESLTPEFDGTLLSISVVPLPLPALLLIGGLGGLVGVSTVAKRRRRRAA